MWLEDQLTCSPVVSTPSLPLPSLVRLSRVNGNENEEEEGRVKEQEEDERKEEGEGDEAISSKKRGEGRKGSVAPILPSSEYKVDLRHGRNADEGERGRGGGRCRTG